MTAAEGRRTNVEMLARLRDVLGGKRVSRSGMQGVAYSRDLWPRRLIEARHGKTPPRPDFIVWPETTEEVSRVLRLCNEARVPVVPIGGGSGLTGAAEPTCGGVALDTKRMNRLERISEKSGIAVCQPGIIGSHLERELNRNGYTLGHFPGSLGTSTLGGWLATRAAGMAATLYGRIEDLVVSMQVVLADGTVLHTRTAPRRATGPDFNHLFLGSEGALGVITRTHLRVRLAPEARFMRGLVFPKLADGLESLRLIMRLGLRPSFVRLSDEADTATTLKALGINVTGCLLALFFDGRSTLVDLSGRKAIEICRAHGGRDHGEEPAQLWYEHRYSEYFRQSEIFDEPGAFTDIIETAGRWRDIAAIHQAVRRAVGKRIELLAHVPHVYPEGCSLQFTMIGKADGDGDLALYDKTWDAVLDAIAAAGGVISHHHGVGRQKAAWLAKHDDAARRRLLGVKQRLDPNNILNPGKLGPAAESPC
jgi:alkyldihydroxyacetonephosphate synthase